MSGFIGFITGKRIGGPSPLLKLIPAVAKALPDVEFDVWEWNEKYARRFIFGHRKLHLIAHSFGCMSAYFLAQILSAENKRYTDDDPLDVEVHITLIDPVRWNSEDDVRNLDGHDEQAIAQIMDQTPFDMPSAVKTCVNYWVKGGFVSSFIVERAGQTNIEVKGVGHNSVVEKVSGEIVTRAVEMGDTPPAEPVGIA